ncbi:hypothetical protein ACHAW6_014420 [Cyclotella cf. meneghiniana]
MKFLSRFANQQSQKEYDGPAACAPMSSFRRPPSSGSVSGSVPRNGLLDVSAHKSTSLGSSITTSIGSTAAADRGDTLLSRRETGSSKYTMSNSVINNGNSNKTKETPSEDTRSTSQKIDRSQPLPPGISSRRTTKRVDKHLPASKMTGNRHRNPNQRPNLQSIAESHSESGTRSHDTYSIAGIPMDHDGGVTCITPLPSSSSSSSTSSSTHRFLTGGVDGTIQLWTIYDNPNVNPRRNQELKPRLIRKYKGHTGYIHQMARLGWFDPKIRSRRDSEEEYNGSELSCEVGGASTASDIKDKSYKRRPRELFVSASRDNTLRIWELDNDDQQGEYGALESVDTLHYANPAKSDKDSATKGRKLRGHVFGGKDHGQSLSGVLCVCSVPSLTSRGGIALHTAGQFASGGSDGVLRIWDVRSALNLERVPKSGLYSTVQIQCLETDKMSVLKDAQDKKEGLHIDGKARGRKIEENSVAVPITSVVCTGDTLDTVALFTADALGTIRRYSPMNQSPLGYVNNSIWWQFTGCFSSGAQSVTSLTILNSTDLAKFACDESASGGRVAMLASASSDGCIRLWNAADAFIEAQVAGSRIDREKMKREPLWKVHLNDDEDMGGEETKSSTSVSTCHNHCVTVTSMSTIQGTRLTAGTNDGAIHIWDMLSESFVGSYTFGRKIQIWSLAVLSEARYQAGNEDICVSIIISGDNRGRIRALKNVLSDKPELSVTSDASTRDGEDSLYDELFRGYSSHTSCNYSMGGSSSRRLIREVDFG